MRKPGWLILIVLILTATAALAGNTIESATHIEVNISYNDNLVNSSDKHYYQFTVPNAGFVTVHFNHDFVDSSSTYWNLQLMDENKKQFMTASYKGNIAEDTSAHYGINAGTYYVYIGKGSSASTVNYEFRIEFTPSDVWESEFNNDIPTADPITTNQYYHGIIWYSSDNDFYQFDIPSNGYVSVSFKHDYVESSSSYWQMDLYNAQRKSYIHTSYTGNVQEEETTINIGLPAGTYYIKINRGYLWGTADYQFRVNYTQSEFWEAEFNNSMTDANSIDVNEHYYGTITTTNDYDYYRFTIPKDGELSILFKHEIVCQDSGTYWKATVMDAQNKSYATELFYGNTEDETESTRFSLAAGTYYLKMEDNKWSGADYRFQVKYEIPKISITGATYESIEDQVYTGKEINPNVKLELNGKELIFGTDYKLSYKKNLNVGKATVTVTGIGDYAGKIKITFKILPKAIKLSSVKPGKQALTVTWSKGGDVTGYEIEYSLKKDFSGAKKITLNGAGNRSKIIKGLKAKKTYYIRVRTFKKVSGKKYYSAWSNVMKKKTK